MIEQQNGRPPTAPAAEPEAVVLRLSERQQQRLAVYVQEAEAARQRASNALTDILIGRDVDLEQFERWGLSSDGQAALLVPKRPVLAGEGA